MIFVSISTEPRSSRDTDGHLAAASAGRTGSGAAAFFLSMVTP